MMDKKTRLRTAFSLAVPDRPPIMGGWLAAPQHIQTLTGCSEDGYWQDPFTWGLAAERILGSDGLTEVFQPIRRGEFRFVDYAYYEKQNTYSVAKILAEFAALPEPEEIAANFDVETEYRKLATRLNEEQAHCEDMLWCPADWELIPRALCYYEYGYENALLTLQQYPDQYRKWIRVNAARSRNQAVLYARAIREGLHPGVILTGEDITGQNGPLVSPKWHRQEQFPLIEYAWEPLLQAGAKIIIHCDGDYRAFVDDMLALGAAGLQGFQSECGMHLEWIVKRRTRYGEPLIILGPMSVTTTLRYGNVDDIRKEVKRTMSICRQDASLVFFTSNTIVPDIPLANIQVFWQSVLESRWD
jgi:hypothetical protein